MCSRGCREEKGGIVCARSEMEEVWEGPEGGAHLMGRFSGELVRRGVKGGKKVWG